MALLWVALGFPAPIVAQSAIYHWIDEKGTAHYTNSPPADRKVEEYRYWVPEKPAPIVRRSGQTEMTSAEGEGEDADGEGAEGEAAEGESAEGEAGEGNPAQIDVTERRTLRLSENIRAVVGSVKNSGAQPAEDVAVRLRITDLQQGDICGEYEVDVEPNTLGPGATGEFRFEAENPCFYGEVEIAVEPLWEPAAS